MIHLLEPARLPDRIYSMPTIAVAETQEAMCCEASAGKSRGVGTFKLMLTAQTHLMKTQLDNRWESDIIREGLRLLEKEIGNRYLITGELQWSSIIENISSSWYNILYQRKPNNRATLTSILSVHQYFSTNKDRH